MNSFHHPRNKTTIKAVDSVKLTKPVSNKLAVTGRLWLQFFWVQKRVIVVEFMETWTTTIAAVYCQTLRRLRKSSKTKGMLTSRVILIHDNVCLCNAAVTQQLLEQFNWNMFNHLAYSPDLVPNDFYVFSELKNWLEAKLLDQRRVIE